MDRRVARKAVSRGEAMLSALIGLPSSGGVEVEAGLGVQPLLVRDSVLRVAQRYLRQASCGGWPRQQQRHDGGGEYRGEERT
jgi:hypothetical protein